MGPPYFPSLRQNLPAIANAMAWCTQLQIILRSPHIMAQRAPNAQLQRLGCDVWSRVAQSYFSPRIPLDDCVRPALLQNKVGISCVLGLQTIIDGKCSNSRQVSLRWHICRAKFAQTLFFLRWMFLRKMLRTFSWNVRAFICGWEKSRKIPAKFPTNLPA